MNLMTSKVTTEEKELYLRQRNYARNEIKNERVIEGSFYQENPITIREMVTRRINKSLCMFLLFTISVTFVSYYVALNYEAKLNTLDNEIVKLNTENQDLQVELDKLKSFNNVDNKIGEFNLLQKAEKVIEVTAMNTQQTITKPSKIQPHAFNWAIGY